MTQFTFNYSQPDDYHFCLDSVLLPKMVAEQTSSSLTDDAVVMDLGSGCGVIGLEFLFHQPRVGKMLLLEKQTVFEPYIHQNITKLREVSSTSAEVNVRINDLRDLPLDMKESCDLLLVNPPYYFADEGLTPPNEVKANCHFFMSSSPEDFVRAIDFLLKPSVGEAYVLVKKPQRWMDAVHNFSDLNVSEAFDVRGTAVLKFRKH